MLVGKHVGKYPSGTSRSGREDNIKMDIIVPGCCDGRWMEAWDYAQ
jgi:hypothetical protein